jgi:hypothetical protein
LYIQKSNSRGRWLKSFPQPFLFSKTMGAAKKLHCARKFPGTPEAVQQQNKTFNPPE